MPKNKTPKPQHAAVGETQLNTLLAQLTPELLEGEFTFCHIPEGQYGDLQNLNPIASFQEKEGLTLVLERQAADDAGLEYQGVFHCITLCVHSSLEAIGLTAAIADSLTTAGISANVIAAFFHDHIFVPAQVSNKAIDTLTALSKKHQ